MIGNDDEQDDDQESDEDESESKDQSTTEAFNRVSNRVSTRLNSKEEFFKRLTRMNDTSPQQYRPTVPVQKRAPIKQDKAPHKLATTNEKMGAVDPQSIRAKTFNFPKDFRSELVKFQNARKLAQAKNTDNETSKEEDKDDNIDEEIKQESPLMSKKVM